MKYLIILLLLSGCAVAQNTIPVIVLNGESIVCNENGYCEPIGMDMRVEEKKEKESFTFNPIVYIVTIVCMTLIFVSALFILKGGNRKCINS